MKLLTKGLVSKIYGISPVPENFDIHTLFKEMYILLDYNAFKVIRNLKEVFKNELSLASLSLDLRQEELQVILMDYDNVMQSFGAYEMLDKVELDDPLGENFYNSINNNPDKDSDIVTVSFYLKMNRHEFWIEYHFEFNDTPYVLDSESMDLKILDKLFLREHNQKNFIKELS